MRAEEFIGTKITRMVGGQLPMTLIVTEVDTKNRTFNCGDWLFNLDTGMEIDDMFSGIVSYVKEITDKEVIIEDSSATEKKISYDTWKELTEGVYELYEIVNKLRIITEESAKTNK